MEVNKRGGQRHSYLNPNAQEYRPYYYNNFLSHAPPTLLLPQPNYPIYPYPHYPNSFYYLNNPSCSLPPPPPPTAAQARRRSPRPKQKPSQAWVEKKKKKTRRERKRKVKVMPVKPTGLDTTVMIRNIPNQYTRRMLMNFVDKFCNEENQGVMKECSDSRVCSADFAPLLLAYDFLYLPIDFKTGANKGYAFVNFSHPEAARKLHCAYNNKGWNHCSSSKICQIACAAIQGKEKLREHFGRSRFMCNQDEYLPVCFNPPRDGSPSQQVTLTTVGELVNPFTSTHRV